MGRSLGARQKEEKWGNFIQWLEQAALMGVPKSAICQTFPVTFSFFYQGTNQKIQIWAIFLRTIFPEGKAALQLTSVNLGNMFYQLDLQV